MNQRGSRKLAVEGKTEKICFRARFDNRKIGGVSEWNWERVPNPGCRRGERVTICGYTFFDGDFQEFLRG